MQNSFLQQTLGDRVNSFIAEADNHSIQRLPSKSHIQGIVIPGNDRIKHVSDQLRMAGIDARPILSPTVAKGSERLRICLHTYNTISEIQLLVQQLSKLTA
jgi:8-amino-7-oxononanoate synthase